jgi:hypothetical protein
VGASAWRPCIAVDSAGRPAAALGQWAAALLWEQGRAVGRGQRGVGAADRRGRAAMGPGGQRRGVGESEREWGSAATGANWHARQHSAGRLSFKLGFKQIQTYSNGSNEI